MRNKKLYFIITVLLTLILVCVLSVISKMSDKVRMLGGRYLTDTFEISSEKEFIDFINSVNEGNQYNNVRVVLTNDLDMSEYENVPQIGIPGTQKYFCGLFDGQGHEIHNITVMNTVTPYVMDALLDQNRHDYHALFLEVPGIICNLTIRNGVMPCNRCGGNVGLFIADTNNASAGIYNCMTLSEYAFFDKIYTGDICNYITDDNQYENFLNSNLKECSARADGILMNQWEETDGTVKMKIDARVGIPDVYLDINSSGFKGKIYSDCQDNIYRLFVPSSNLDGRASLNIRNAVGEHYIEDFNLDGVDRELAINALGEEINLEIYFAKNTEAVIINTDFNRGIDYVKADILHMPKGNIQILDKDGNTNVLADLDYFRGRGNNSWTKTDKKGYKIKIGKEFNVLDMGVASEFYLISGSRDASLFTYKLCEDLWKDMKFDFCRDNTIVNLYVDGEYQGAYLFVESIEVRPGRIEINDLADVTGDYLYEIDNRYYRENPYSFSTDLNTYIIDNAHEPNKYNFEYSTNFMKEYESAVMSDDSVAFTGRKLSEICDIDSLAKQLLSYEMLSEWSTEQSVFWVKYSDYSGDGKLHALAPWDIEHSLLHTELEGLSLLEFNRASGLYESLMRKPEIISAMKDNYNKILRNALLKIVSDEDVNDEYCVHNLDYYCEEYEQPSKWNALVWGERKSFDSKAEEVKLFLDKKIGILDEYFADK